MQKKLYPIIIIVTMLYSCSSSKYAVIVNYYNQNIDLHNKIVDSVKILSSQFPEGVIFVRGPHNSITVRCFRNSKERNVPMYFDSLLNRSDPYPELTSKIKIPVSAIHNFNSTIYQAMLADSVGVFFAHRYYDKNKEYGLLLFNDETNLISKNIIEIISKNACVYKSFID